MSNLFSALAKRHSVYDISKDKVLPDSDVHAIVNEAINLTPSAFNAQTQRAIILFGDQSDKFWDLTKEELSKIVPAEDFGPTEAKLNAFRNGQGTILFFIDKDVVKGLQENAPLYADNFPIWAQQENGGFQLVVWTALAEKGIGATLQHYNPVVDALVQKEFNAPANWQLLAQMPFGKIATPADARDKIPASEKVKVF